MSYPPGIVTRPVLAGDALAVTDGKPLIVKTVTVASRALIHVATGTRLEKVTNAEASPYKGEVLYWQTAVTDRDSEYLDADTRELIVLGPDEHTHTYTTTLTVWDEDEKVGEYVIGPYAVPTPEEPSQVMDLDTLQVVDITTGTAIPIPESWTQIVSDAQNAVGELEPALGDIADLKTKTTTGYLAPGAVATAAQGAKADAAVPNTTSGRSSLANSSEITNRITAVASSRDVLPIYSDMFGCKGDGVTDDTAALTALYAFAAARAKSSSVFGAVTQIIFRAGRYIDSLPRVFDFRVVLTGEGKDQTILYRKNGSTGDFLTFNVSYSGTDRMTVDGNANNCPSAGDNVVLNAYRTSVQSTTVTKANGNNIVIGKENAALGHILYGLGVSEAKGYGILTVAGSGSTDGMWTLLDVGKNGKSGVRLDQGAQNILGLHAWGNGIEDDTDKHGIHVNSSSNVIVGAQSETNNGDGVYISGSASRDNEIDVKAWGNGGSGVRIFSAPSGKLTGRTYRNGINNSSGSSSTSFSGVLNDSGTDWVISVSSRDDTAAVGAGSYVTAPTYPFPGRTAGGSFTQTYAYAEVGTADRNVLIGCKMRKEDHKTGALLIVGNNDIIPADGNDFGGVTVPTRSVSSGAVRAPADSDFIDVATSGANISSVLGGRKGRRVTIRFIAATPGTVTNSASLRLSGNVDWTPNQYATLTLISDGTNWTETGRKL